MYKKFYVDPIWQMFSVRAMIQVALSMKVNKGVAFVAVRGKRQEIAEIKYGIVNDMFQRESRGYGDRPSNYFGVAMEKLAVMMDTGTESGHIASADLKYGESSYRGGLMTVDDDYTIYTGFSGGTEDQDVEIAKVGMKMMLTKRSDE